MAFSSQADNEKLDEEMHRQLTKRLSVQGIVLANIGLPRTKEARQHLPPHGMTYDAVSNAATLLLIESACCTIVADT